MRGPLSGRMFEVPLFASICPLFCVFWEEHRSMIVSFLFFPPCLHGTELITPSGCISHLSHKVFETSGSSWSVLSATFVVLSFKTTARTYTHPPPLDTPLSASGRSLWFTWAETLFPCFPFLWRIERLLGLLSPYELKWEHLSFLASLTFVLCQPKENKELVWITRMMQSP